MPWCTSASTFCTTGMDGSLQATSAIASPRRLAASRISGVCEGTLTASFTALRTPRSPSSASARSTAAACPPITICPGELWLAGTTMPSCDASRQTSSTSASSAPITAAIAPLPAGAASCISCPRRRTRRAPSSSDSAPAETSAAYSPRLCPARSAGCAPPASCQARHTPIPAASSAGWVNSVWLSRSPGPCWASAHRSTPAPCEASSKLARTTACASARPASIPVDWDPWPGKTKASCGSVTALAREKAAADGNGPAFGLSVPDRRVAAGSVEHAGQQGQQFDVAVVQQVDRQDRHQREHAPATVPDRATEAAERLADARGASAQPRGRPAQERQPLHCAGERAARLRRRAPQSGRQQHGQLPFVERYVPRHARAEHQPVARLRIRQRHDFDGILLEIDETDLALLIHGEVAGHGRADVTAMRVHGGDGLDRTRDQRPRLLRATAAQALGERLAHVAQQQAILPAPQDARNVRVDRGEFGQPALFDPASVRPDVARRRAQRDDAQPQRRPVHRAHAQGAPGAAIALEPCDAAIDVQAPDHDFLSHPADSLLSHRRGAGTRAAAAPISTAAAPSPR